MARAKDKGSLTGAENNFKCPICLDIYEEPVKISCGHSFCKDCIMGCLSKVSITQCPVCRTSFKAMHISDNTRLANLIKTCTSSETCSKCNKLVKLSSVRDHKDTCTGTLDSKSRLIFTPVAPSSRPETARVTPNRSTFKCPYCNKANLDREALKEHVSDNHCQDPQQVVCPTCASMPWGDPDQKSGNFQQHLNMRHQYDYDTFVDFNHEEDSTLQDVIERSKNER